MAGISRATAATVAFRLDGRVALEPGQARFVETILQAGPARVLGAQFQDALGERGLFALAFGERPQVRSRATARSYSLVFLVAVISSTCFHGVSPSAASSSRRVFGQAREWVGKVSGLRAGGPVISATVDGVPVSVRILLDGIAGECECPADGLCAHAVAAVMAWVRTGTDPDEPDLFEVLRMQDPDWLATRLAELAAADPALAERLLAEAEDGEALEDVAGLRAELDEVLDELEAEAVSGDSAREQRVQARP